MIVRSSLWFAVTCLFVLYAAAQQKHEGPAFVNAPRPLNCEIGEALMENMTAKLEKEFKDAGVLVAIAHLGNGESSRELNHRRLYNVREYLKDHGIQKERIIVAEGEHVTGYGRIDFYLEGKLVDRALLKPKRDFCIICCAENGPYYPQKDNSDRELKKRVKK